MTDANAKIELASTVCVPYYLRRLPQSTMSGDFPHKNLMPYNDTATTVFIIVTKRMNTDKEFLVALSVLMSQTHNEQTPPMISKQLSKISDSIDGLRQQIDIYKDNDF